MTLASPSAAVVIHHYVSFDDNEEDWFDLILLEKKKTLQWLDEHDKQPVVKATPKRKATKGSRKRTLPARNGISVIHVEQLVLCSVVESLHLM